MEHHKYFWMCTPMRKSIAYPKGWTPATFENKYNGSVQKWMKKHGDDLPLVSCYAGFMHYGCYNVCVYSMFIPCL